MDARHFDTIARLFTDRGLTRRRALAVGSTSLAATALAGVGVEPAAAEEATPATAEDSEKIEYLFVQSFQSGSVTPKAGAEGTYTLTLDQGLGQTISFSDRPERVVGATPTPQFLEGLGFAADDPPNAALVVANPDGTTNVAVLELTNPVYDPAGPGITYDVTVLAEWEKEVGIDFHEVPADLASLPATFGPASLFIDDCPDTEITCYAYVPNNDPTFVGSLGKGHGMCWNYSLCEPCEPYGHSFPYYCAAWDYWKQQCNAAFPSACAAHGCAPNWAWLPPKC